MDNKQRCSWVNMQNELYVEYHDKEWSVACYDDKELFELLILELFQAGLSWECILNKRKNFEVEFDNFDIDKIVSYDSEKIENSLKNAGIIRNRLKINAMINNAKVFKKIQNEYNSFSNYIWGFTNNKTIIETGKTKSDLSDLVSDDLKERGMKFVGSTIIYSYLQAIGVIYSHDDGCYLNR